MKHTPTGRLASPKKNSKSRLVWVLIALAVGCVWGVWLLNERQSSLDRKLVAALHDAQYHAARDLLDQGADPNTRISEFLPDREPLDALRDILRYSLPSSEEAKGDPPLLLCKPRPERLPLAANPPMRDEANRVLALEALIRHGARVDDRIYGGLTMVQKAAAVGDITLLKVLLAHGASQRTITHSPPPLNMATGVAAEMLITYGADVNARFVPSVSPNSYGRFQSEAFVSPLSHAMSTHDLNEVRLLLTRGAAPSICTHVVRVTPGRLSRPNFSSAPLFDVCASRPDLLALFLERYGEINRRNESGATLLAEVIKSDYMDERAKGHREALVRLLLNHGADPAVPDAQGRNAIDEAEAAISRYSLDSLTVARYRVILKLLRSEVHKP